MQDETSKLEGSHYTFRGRINFQLKQATSGEHLPNFNLKLEIKGARKELPLNRQLSCPSVLVPVTTQLTKPTPPVTTPPIADDRDFAA